MDGFTRSPGPDIGIMYRSVSPCPVISMDRKICEATKPKIVTILSGNEIMAEDWGRFSDHLGILSHHIRTSSSPKGRNLSQLLRTLDAVDCAEKIEEQIGNEDNNNCKLLPDEDSTLSRTFSRFHSFFHPHMKPVFVTNYYQKFDKYTFLKFQYERVLKLAENYCQISERYPRLEEREKEEFHTLQEKLRDKLKNDNKRKFVLDMFKACETSLQDTRKQWDVINFQTFCTHFEEDEHSITEECLIRVKILLLTYGRDT
ncbi:hypothetical protein Fcan01_17516 [Folsomia candida]|uniref:Uncharacterized protein n=1 Tax=Folsomia candida TaxID=158441 RepID=A0A226DQC8_FOLCA|nr:hypothetical protein Fcan01_17516 [Folsomia candida]